VPNRQAVPIANVEPVTVGSNMGLRAVRDELREQGVSPGQLVNGTEVEERWFDAPDFPLNVVQRKHLLRNAQMLARRPDTAIRIGLRQTLADFGIMGYGMACSARFGDAFRFGLSQVDLAGKVLGVDQIQEDGVLKVRSIDFARLGPLLPFYSEFWRATLQTVLSACLGRPFRARSMRFPYPQPKYLAAYIDAFDCELVFDAPVLEFSFDIDLLNEPLPDTADETAAFCKELCSRIIGDIGAANPITREVRMVLLQHLRRSLSAPEVAAELKMSTRTLYRRLEEAGHSFQSLSDSVRLTVAAEYLDSTAMSVSELAFRTGFSDTANFRRAFRRWTGVTPSKWRERGAIL